MAFDSSPASSRPDHEILIIGTGFSGLGAAIRLQQKGHTDFHLLEKEHEVGGTWFVNSYPGCACDVPSHVYSFSFEPNPDWSRSYSGQPEILAYLKRCADKYDIRRRVSFGVHVVRAVYDEAACLWRVAIADAAAVREYLARRGLKPGDAIDYTDPELPPTRQVSARVLISGMGPLSTPAYPNLKGIESFQGTAFHSQQWNHDYDLKGKRVAVIGTGASAIQFVPQIQKQVAQLDLYQRTPPWILPKPDVAISPEKRALFRKRPLRRWLERIRLYWMQESIAIGFVYKPSLTAQARKMALDYLKAKVADPVLRAKLTPDYDMGCKRVLLTRDYLPALTQANVDVVTDSIREVRAHSIVDAQGVERPVDAIIYGTGFRVADLLPRGAVLGRGGLDLMTHWDERPEAYKGTTVAGFPNLFVLVGPNTALGHNSIVFMIEAQLNYIIGALDLMRRKQLAAIEVKQDTQDRYNDWLQKKSVGTVWTSGRCSSYYLHPKTGRNFTIWPGFTFTFRRLLRRFDAGCYTLTTANTIPTTKSKVQA